MSNDFQQEATRSNGFHPGLLDYAAAARFAALAARAFARFATRAALRAGDIFFFAAFTEGAFTAAFLTTTFFAAAFFAAHRFFKAATMFALPALLSFRLALGAGAGVDGAATLFDSAHRFRCASAIALLPAALIFRRLGVVASEVAAVSAEPPGSIARSSAMRKSI